MSACVCGGAEGDLPNSIQFQYGDAGGHHIGPGLRGGKLDMSLGRAWGQDRDPEPPWTRRGIAGRTLRLRHKGPSTRAMKKHVQFSVPGNVTHDVVFQRSGKYTQYDEKISGAIYVNQPLQPRQ